MILKYRDFKLLTKIKVDKNLDWKVAGLSGLMEVLNCLIMLVKSKELQVLMLF